VEQQRIVQLGAGLASLGSGAATPETDTRVLRTALSESVVRIKADHIEMILAARRPHRTESERTGKHRRTIPEDRLGRSRAGAADARPANRAAPQPRRRARQRVGRRRECARSAAAGALRFIANTNGLSEVRSRLKQLGKSWS
jgi:hypothetical protein